MALLFLIMAAIILVQFLIITSIVKSVRKIINTKGFVETGVVMLLLMKLFNK